jgi:mono/diheme cytochrome c family protein
MVDRGRPAIDPSASLQIVGGDGKVGEIERDFLPRVVIQPVGDPFHLRMAARAVSEIFELPRSITRIEPGKPRRKVSVAFSLDPVAGYAGGVGAGRAAAERDEFAAGFERVARGRGRAGGESVECRAGKQGKAERHSIDQPAANMRGSLSRAAGVALVLAAALVGCKPPPENRHDFDPAAVERGRAVVAASGCVACHAFPDIAWPKGRAGPALVAFDGKGPIAGALPNTPDNLAAFVRNAPAAKPGSPMPAMPISPSEARDVAAYLYGISE